MENKNVPCAVVGAAGRMGKRICELLATSERLHLAGATERPDYPGLGETLQVSGSAASGITLAGSLEAISKPFDVIIDFTFPATSMETARFASRMKKAAVLGSTGFSGAELEEIKQLSRSFPCVCAPNMSVGINTLFKLVREVAQILGQKFDAEIVEAHHRNKKDAPSGTALKIAQILAQAYGRDLSRVGVYARKGFIGERTTEEIGIQTIRGGDIVGDHTVLFCGQGERLELTHRAQSRDTFVHGALRAALWVLDKPNGLYDMQDVLGLK